MVRNYVHGKKAGSSKGKRVTPRTVYAPGSDAEATLNNAVEEVKRGESIRSAAKHFDIPYAVLHSRVKMTVTHSTPGHPVTLDEAEEDEIAACLLVLANFGYGLTESEVCEVVGSYVSSTKKQTPFKGGIPGQMWFTNFMKRHPNLSKRKGEQLSKARARNLTSKVFEDWYDLLEGTYEKLEHPAADQIWNVDETGFTLDPKAETVIAKKGQRNVYQSTGGSGREHITVQGCVSASGRSMPPMIVYKGKNLYERWCKGTYPGMKYTVSEKGWMTSEIFLGWFRDMFLKQLSPERPVLLILDGHISHISYPVVKMATENEVSLLKLPPHTTSHLQPLDKVTFGVMKEAWQKQLRQYVRQTRSRMMGKDDFSRELSKCWLEVMTPSHITAGFVATGVYPLDRSKIPDEIKSTGDAFSGISNANKPHQKGNSEETCSSSTSPVSPISRPAIPPRVETDPSAVNPREANADEPCCSSTSATLQINTSMPLPSSAASLHEFFVESLFSPSHTSSMSRAELPKKSVRKRVSVGAGELLTSEQVVSRLKEQTCPKTKRRTTSKKPIRALPVAESSSDDAEDISVRSKTKRRTTSTKAITTAPPVAESSSDDADDICVGCNANWNNCPKKLQREWVACDLCDRWTCTNCLPADFDIDDDFFCVNC